MEEEIAGVPVSLMKEAVSEILIDLQGYLNSSSWGDNLNLYLPRQLVSEAMGESFLDLDSSN
jgi:hypothetical protein